MSAQIKSKQRVSDHGEVYTSEKEINAMLDLVKSESYRIESRFLEPACGNGNFCAAVLKRKLDVVKTKYKRSQSEYEKYSFLAVSTIYGIDILEDNVVECRKRLLDLFSTEYKSIYKKKINPQMLTAVEYVLFKNVLWGNALTMRCSENAPLVVAEWSMLNRGMVKRRDFIYEQLINSPKNCKPVAEEEINLFDIGTKINKIPKGAFIPTPIKEYPLTYYKDYSKNHKGGQGNNENQKCKA